MLDRSIVCSWCRRMRNFHRMPSVTPWGISGAWTHPSTSRRKLSTLWWECAAVTSTSVHSFPWPCCSRGNRSLRRWAGTNRIRTRFRMILSQNITLPIDHVVGVFAPTIISSMELSRLTLIQPRSTGMTSVLWVTRQFIGRFLVCPPLTWTVTPLA